MNTKRNLLIAIKAAMMIIPVAEVSQSAGQQSVQRTARNAQHIFAGQLMTKLERNEYRAGICEIRKAFRAERHQAIPSYAGNAARRSPISRLRHTDPVEVDSLQIRLIGINII